VSESNRWEWRTFARSPAYSGILDDQQFVESPPTREHYVLSVVSPNNVKIRSECLDIKTLVARDATGLEQWRPVLKAPFPIDEAALRAAWSAWCLPLPVVARRECTFDEFLTEIVAPEPALCAVQVEKQRRKLVVEDCTGEHATIRVGGDVWESIAFEHIDPLRVWRAVRHTGLENAENTSYPAALKKIVGLRVLEQTINREQL
jgi:exopolyphosphatase/guanosine-5'-triphosphate,3'-diphosphate pyrophosphatase